MNIPDEAEKRWPVNDDSPQTFALRVAMRETFKQGAEWARREALREAAEDVRARRFDAAGSEPNTFYAGVRRSEVAIRALAEGEQA